MVFRTGTPFSLLHFEVMLVLCPHAIRALPCKLLAPPANFSDPGRRNIHDDRSLFRTICLFSHSFEAAVFASVDLSAPAPGHVPSSLLLRRTHPHQGTPPYSVNGVWLRCLCGAFDNIVYLLYKAKLKCACINTEANVTRM